MPGRQAQLSLLWVLVASLAWTPEARPAPLTWTLDNVVFEDGAVASGTFVYDAALNSVSEWNVSVSGGDVVTFPAVSYDSSLADHHFEVGVLTGLQIFFFEIGSPLQRQLALAATPGLSDAGGRVALEVGAFSHSYECFNCVPYRFVGSGTLVPEPESPAARGSTAVLGLAALARRLRRALDPDPAAQRGRLRLP